MSLLNVELLCTVLFDASSQNPPPCWCSFVDKAGLRCKMWCCGLPDNVFQNEPVVLQVARLLWSPTMWTRQSDLDGYLSGALYPAVPFLLWGRSASYDPPVRKEHAVWFLWKDVVAQKRCSGV